MAIKPFTTMTMPPPEQVGRTDIIVLNDHVISFKHVPLQNDY